MAPHARLMLIRHLGQQLGKISLGFLIAAGLTVSCSSTQQSLSALDAVTVSTDSQLAASPAAAGAEFTICGESATWQRPDPRQQHKQLATDGRYSELLDDKAFQQVANQFWDRSILSFTTYGLSARTEPMMLSGLWSLDESVWTACYSGSAASDINAGLVAEAWLLHHRVVDMQWQGDRYLMVVEPTLQGMQVVQFARRDRSAELPLSVVTVAGEELPVQSGDWR